MSKLSHNLKHLLNNAKISENELARRTGVPQQVINRILSGENTNPKIATLSPLANYFMISISEMIEDEYHIKEVKLNRHHLGWQTIPLVDWELLDKVSLSKAISQSQEKILVDISAQDLFAVKMQDDSMSPKFILNTLLIFDPNKKPLNADFSLICIANKEIIFRQVFFKNEKCYIKGLHPKNKDYKLRLLSKNYVFWGTLVQSKTDYPS